ncbi:hypothetical protein BJ992_001044 [Sphaerisporangium rubeum]|uniref:Uncharacterized protein n=1 Tax=Sphaerisporangium rubeum TaxID=321317 RepID=A0A7X0ICU7_9ACTN|nr:hypothetical protein [Sphaerisporangium rubeum]MBB6471613.1 hypothetical protein [Sphaerisporangium rubeum]
MSGGPDSGAAAPRATGTSSPSSAVTYPMLRTASSSAQLPNTDVTAAISASGLPAR